MRNVVALLLFVTAGCAGQPRKLAATAPSPAAQPAPQQAPAPSALRPTPFAGKASPVDNHGREVKSVDEYPFMFRGRLMQGGDHCDESEGFTFANIKSLGQKDAECTYEVGRQDEPPMTTWLVVCTTHAQGMDVVVSTSLGVSDQASIGQDGKTPYRPSIFGKLIGIPGLEGSEVECMYSGAVVERALLQAAP